MFSRRDQLPRGLVLSSLAGDAFGITYELVKFIGNAASLGAKMALLSCAERDYAEQLRHRTEHVDLSLDPGFQMEFGEALLFPGE